MNTSDLTWDITFGPGHVFVVITASGIATPESLSRMARSVARHRNWKPGTPVVCDFRAISFSRISSPEILDLTRQRHTYMPMIGDSPVAIVVGSTEDAGLVRRYQTSSGETTGLFAVFSEFESAAAWIHQTRKTLPPGSGAFRMTDPSSIG